MFDNITSGLSTVMPSFDDVVEGAKEVANFTRERGTQSKFIELCLDTPDRFWAIPLIKEFTAEIYLGRWGTLMFAIPCLIRLLPLIF